MEKLICGVDLHKKFSVICLMNQTGEILDQKRLNHQGGDFEEYFKALAPTDCVIEPVEHWGWAVDSLEEMGHQVRLANPYKVRLIAESRVKTDKVDARVLADLYRAGYLPESYVAPLTLRDERTYLRYRIQLARQRTRLKNQIKRLLRLEGKEYPGKSLFTKRGKVWLNQTHFRPIHERIKEETLKTLEGYDELISRMNREILQKAQKDSRAELLMTIPGVGKLTAQVLLAEIGDIHRFKSAKRLVGYMGFGVSERSSGGKVRRGNIAKTGNHHLRWLFVEAAHKAKLGDEHFKKFFDRIAHRRGKNRATVALARKLAEISWHLLTKKEPFDSKKVCRRFG